MQLEFTPAVWQIWCLTALALFMVMAIEFDLLQRRIPNLLIVLMLLTGIALNTLGPANGREGLLAKFPGALGAGMACWGALTGLALFLPFYILRAFGAGDVKLLAALGSFLGPLEVINLSLCVLAAGGLLAMLRMLWAKNLQQVVSNIILILNAKREAGRGRPIQRISSADRIPFALAFGVGLLAYNGWRLVGGTRLIHF